MRGPAWLVDDDGREWPLDGPTVIGRAPDCEVRLLDPTITRLHARIQADGDGWRITDLGGPTSTFVDGERVGSAPLRDGTDIRVGDVALRFREAAR